ncbi:MAG: protein kinase domain-containing protein [Thermoguttaceae bacterium]
MPKHKVDSSTQLFDRGATRLLGSQDFLACDEKLRKMYHDVLGYKRVAWEEELELGRLLGKGGQGVVFLSQRRGADGFVLPVALKFYSPERYSNEQYEETMSYVAYIASRVAKIQHDSLLDVRTWRNVDRIRVMEMEWIDGIDLTLLLRNSVLEHLKSRQSAAEFKRTNDVVITSGPIHPRLKPGVAIPIIRDCLGALAALHREGIVHGDMKPSNIMVKRTGSAKLVDMGSAFDVNRRPSRYVFTPAYASLEALEGRDLTQRGDMTSLGYVLIEMLSGRRLFDGADHTTEDPIQDRYTLPQRLQTLLPKQVASSELLTQFCTRLISPDPNEQFENSEVADIGDGGAGELVRQLIKGDLACEPTSELRNLLDSLQDYEHDLVPSSTQIPNIPPASVRRDSATPLAPTP